MDDVTLAEEVGRGLRDHEAEAPLDDARARFEASYAGRATDRRSWVRAASGASIVLAAAAALVVFFWARPTPSFVVGDGAPGRSGEWLDAPSDTSLPLRFSDGATVLLAPGARARIEDLDSRGARCRVERGRIAVAVPHRRDTDWWFELGPYDIHVTGTRFDTAWDPTLDTFEIEMFDGSVEVVGPGLDAPHAVVAGQRWTNRGRSSSATSDPTDAHASGALADATDEVAGEGETDEVDDGLREAEATEPRTLRRAPIPPRGSARTDWRELARAGSYGEAISRVEVEGIDSVVRTASARDLLLLGDAARYAARPELARRAYEAIRVPGGDADVKAEATFALGRVAASEGRHGAAATEFRRYLDERPTGRLAREALGRLLESHHRAGDRAAAVVVARRYVEEYPNGPYATLAQSLLGARTGAGP